MDKEHKDPWRSDYCSLSAPVFKLGLRSKVISEKTKVHILRNWVASNSFLKNQSVVFEMLQCLDLKKLLDSISKVTSMVRKIIFLTDNIGHCLLSGEELASD